jgi:hypothetical protein
LTLSFPWHLCSVFFFFFRNYVFCSTCFNWGSDSFLYITRFCFFEPNTELMFDKNPKKKKKKHIIPKTILITLKKISIRILKKSNENLSNEITIKFRFCCWGCKRRMASKTWEMDDSATRKWPVFNWVRAYVVMGFRLVSFGPTSKYHYPWPWPIGPCKHKKLKIKNLKLALSESPSLSLSLFFSFFFF